MSHPTPFLRVVRVLLYSSNKYIRVFKYSRLTAVTTSAQMGVSHRHGVLLVSMQSCDFTAALQCFEGTSRSDREFIRVQYEQQHSKHSSAGGWLAESVEEQNNLPHWKGAQAEGSMMMLPLLLLYCCCCDV